MESDEETYKSEENHNYIKKEKSKNGKFFNESEFFSYDIQNTNNGKEYIKLESIEIAEGYNSSNKIELRNVSEIKKAESIEIEQIRKIINNSHFINNFALDVDKFYDTVIN